MCIVSLLVFVCCCLIYGVNVSDCAEALCADTVIPMQIQVILCARKISVAALKTKTSVTHVSDWLGLKVFQCRRITFQKQR